MNRLPLACGIAALLACAQAGAANTPSMEELWQLVQKQQAEIEALKQQLQSTQQNVAKQEQQSQATEQKLVANEQLIAETDASVQEILDRPPSKSEWAENTQIGGYGELHYNGGDADQIDFHRFVLFFGHQFSDRVRLNTELELEHSLAGDGAPGEVELEQAYIEFDINSSLRTKAGLFLLPIGMLNEVHEPPTFYGVERNPIESRIIPTTWWEAGASLSGEFSPSLRWDAAVHSGLATSASSNYAVRNGRQKVAEALADDLAYTFRLRYLPIPGLQLAANYQRQEDITQSQDPLAGGADLWSAHAIWNVNGFGLKALWARWNLDGAGPRSLGADVQKGYFIEPSYQFNKHWGVFARYNEWDNRAGDRIDSEFQQTDVGVNFWPHPNVVLKADYQFQSLPNGGDGDDRINLGVGYQF
ncbi:porin [Pseudomarimonas arenosa]|uniref:Porin n=1 Tax=Pseudomarimonas arenosa TaxID=2774145 RepID=A0AAW3ZL28_9GAMM|nr:porin [Pseudomarimonas arenosa]MBD8526741.1 porin [Pseudomarimonas arenosa]